MSKTQVRTLILFYIFFTYQGSILTGFILSGLYISMGKCGKSPCLCNSTPNEQKIEIPFMGDSHVTNNTTPEQLATFLAEEDKIPVLLALSLYTGTPRNNIHPWELINSSITPRTACWIFNQTVIVGCRGTCVPCYGGDQDLGDDKVKSLTSKKLQNSKTSKPQNLKTRPPRLIEFWSFGVSLFL